MIFLLLIIAACLLTPIIFGIRDGVRASKRENKTKKSPPTSRPPLDFATHVQKQPASVSQYQEKILDMISEDFTAMVGWDEWNVNVHRQPGQFERLKRATEENICIIRYDGDYKLGIVAGSQGDRYIVNHKQCSCPDFRSRFLPCKHMYALAVALDGDIEQNIGDSTATPLYGLKIALAGKFKGSRDDPDGIRAAINKQGAVWQDTIYPATSAVVIGEDPSIAKMQFASQYSMIILAPDDISRVFNGNSNTEE